MLLFPVPKLNKISRNGLIDDRWSKIKFIFIDHFNLFSKDIFITVEM